MTKMPVKIGAGGRLVIPAAFRAALGVAPGDTVVLVMEQDGLRILTSKQAVRRAQAMVGRYASAGRGLADELIAERHEEADAS